MIGTRKFAALALALLLSGCKVGPNYKRPVLSTPDQYRGVAPDLPGQPAAQPFAEMHWETVFQDEALRALIKEALTNNYDMQIAASRILQAEAVVGITRANQLPSVSGGGGVDYQHNSLALNGPTIDSVGISLNYIVDFWGKYRRATEAASGCFLSRSTACQMRAQVSSTMSRYKARNGCTSFCTSAASLLSPRAALNSIMHWYTRSPSDGSGVGPTA